MNSSRFCFQPGNSGLVFICAGAKLVLLSILFFGLAPFIAFGQTNSLNQDFVRAGEYVVVRASAQALHSQTPQSNQAVGVYEPESETQLLQVEAPTQQVAPVTAYALSTKAVVPFDPAQNECDHLRQLDPTILACSPNFLRKRFLVPSDSFVSSQSNLLKGSPSGVDAPLAWEYSTGSREVVIAILDSGLDYTHPDLLPNIWVNPHEIAGNGVDDDQNGYIDDVHGIDAAAGSGDPQSSDAHGTHVAGIIGAVGNNGIGVSGVSWSVSLLAIKASDEEGFFSTFDIAKGLDYVRRLKVERGARIVAVNASFGGFSPSDVEFRAIERLRLAGILFVAAAGNESANIDRNPVFPASYQLDNIISVLATDERGARANFSNYGFLNADIAAPGTRILSTLPFGSYGRLDGTSMATPMVAGALALGAAVRPDLSGEELRAALFSSGAVVPSLDALTSTGRFLDVGSFIARIFDGSTAGTPDAIPASPRIVRDMPFRLRFLSRRGARTRKFRAGRSLHLILNSGRSISPQSAATIYLRFVVNSVACELPVKISDIARESFQLDTSTRGTNQVSSLGVRVLNGEGVQVFSKQIKNSRSRDLQAFTPRRSVHRRVCNSLISALRVR